MIAAPAAKLATADLNNLMQALDLATTAAPVEVVAYNAGYKSRPSFVRAFRKAYNVDPSEYRQRMKNGESLGPLPWRVLLTDKRG